MKKTLLLSITFFILLFSSCQVTTSDMRNAEKFEDSVNYFQCKKTGEVYAIVIIRRQLSPYQEGIGLSHIPQSQLTPEIIKEVENYNPDLNQ